MTPNPNVLYTLLVYLQVLRPAFTKPGYRKMLVLFVGWILTRGRHAITQALVETKVSGQPATSLHPHHRPIHPVHHHPVHLPAVDIARYHRADIRSQSGSAIDRGLGGAGCMKRFR